MKTNPARFKALGAALLGTAALSLAFDLADQAPVEAKSAPKIAWQSSFENALTAAKRSGKPIMVDFYATWCGPCKMLDRDVWTKAPVIQESRNWISVKVDGEKRLDLLKRYGVTAFPTIAFLKPDGNVSKLHLGFIPHAQMKQMMRSQRLKATVRSA